MTDRPDTGVRTRFAPSPTGHLHVGGARTALFSWLYARANGGVFVLRLEDTDTERSTEEAVDQILGSMSWLGLDWDEGPGVGGGYGPYRQMERQELYANAAAKLLSGGYAYRCFCTPERIAGVRESAVREKRTYTYDRICRHLPPDEQEARAGSGEAFVIRLKTPQEGVTVVHDMVRGDVEFDNSIADDYIIVRTSGVPTYNFAAAIDDREMEITHVIRGDDHLSNTPKQILVIEALGGRVPSYAHLPLIVGNDKAPLSKRHGSVSVEEFRSQGYLREALVNYLALLGWSLDGETTLFSIDELVEKFTIERVGRTAAVFDGDKLLWMNGSYIRSLDGAELGRRIGDYLAGTELDGLPGSDGRPTIAEIVPLVQEKMKTLADFIELTGFFFLPFGFEEKARTKLVRDSNAAAVIAAAIETLGRTEPFTVEMIEEGLRRAADLLDLKLGKFLQPIRIAVSGRTVTPGMFETVAILGRETCLERLRSALEVIKNG